MPYSYNGWSASSVPSAIGIDSSFRAAGHDFPGGVRKGDVSTVLRYVIEQFDERVEEVDEYRPGDEWGYSYRNSRNSNALSCHASGTAVDINATQHPNGRRGTFTSNQVVAIRQILAECSRVIRWGGDFAGTPDEMHFEIIGSAAQVRAAAEKIRSNSQPAHEAEEDPMADLHGVARLLFTTYLGRNPADQAELDAHAWALAVHGLNARIQQLQTSVEGVAFASVTHQTIDAQVKTARRDIRALGAATGVAVQS